MAEFETITLMQAVCSPPPESIQHGCLVEWCFALPASKSASLVIIYIFNRFLCRGVGCDSTDVNLDIKRAALSGEPQLAAPSAFATRPL